MALERPYKITGLRDAQAGKRDRAPEPMRGQPAWRLNALINNRTARLAQAGKRDRAPELMRGQPAWRLNALINNRTARLAQAGKRDRANARPACVALERPLK